MGINANAMFDKDVIEVTVLGDDESLAKMSGGDVDVELYQYSRNTIGHGNHNSNSQRPKQQWWKRKVEVYVGVMLQMAWAVVPLGWPVVPLVVLSGGTAQRGGCTARVGIHHRSNRGAILGRKWMISGVKLERFRGREVGRLGEKLDPLETKQIQDQNQQNIIKTNKSQKKLGLFLVGIFGFRTKTTKSS